MERVRGVKSSRSPRISVGSFTEFIFNEVAPLARTSQGFRGTLQRILRGHGNAPARAALRPFLTDARRRVGVAKQGWRRKVESKRGEERIVDRRNDGDVMVAHRVLPSRVFRRARRWNVRQHAGQHARAWPGQFRGVSRGRRCAHTSGNGDGGMVDNVMMASAGRGGAGLRGDQYYPPPPPFPRPCISRFLSPSLLPPSSPPLPRARALSLSL